MLIVGWKSLKTKEVGGKDLRIVDIRDAVHVEKITFCAMVVEIM